LTDKKHWIIYIQKHAKVECNEETFPHNYSSSFRLNFVIFEHESIRKFAEKNAEFQISQQKVTKS